MLRLYCVLAVLGSLLSTAQTASADPLDRTVNSVLGDASWHRLRGTDPSAAPEQERLQVHLRYVHDLLVHKTSDRWNEAQLQRRSAALRALAAYVDAGVFPRRTQDNYAGRRPRFIDDRGVHCAVGHLMAVSGHGALAQAINEREPYALVPEIQTVLTNESAASTAIPKASTAIPKASTAVPEASTAVPEASTAVPEVSTGVRQWASVHGFTVRELAMIQPGYEPPPTEASVLRALEGMKDPLTLACARRAPPPESFTIRVRGDSSGRAHLSSRDGSDFVACFLEHAESNFRGGGAYDGSPSRFRARLRVEVTPPAQLLQQALEGLYLESNATGCLPRPGAVPEYAYVRVQTSPEELRVVVKTAPRNDEVAQCLAELVLQRVSQFAAGQWRLRASTRRPLGPIATPALLSQHLGSYARNFATECLAEDEPEVVDPDTPATQLRIEVRGVMDAPAFEVQVTGGSPEMNQCVEAALAEPLMQTVSGRRRMPDGTLEPFARIDADVEVELELEVESRAARRERIRRQREEMENQMNHY